MSGIQKPRNCTMQEIRKIKNLYNLKKKGKRLYSQKRLGQMFFVDQKTIFNYLRLKVGRAI